jgi:hypothetical protein
MIRIVLFGMLLIVVMLVIWVAWAEYQAFRAARERARHEEQTGG